MRIKDIKPNKIKTTPSKVKKRGGEPKLALDDEIKKIPMITEITEKILLLIWKFIKPEILSK